MAPYWRFRATSFYADSIPGGVYAADIMYCDWSCELCWSKYGWRGTTPRREFTGAQAARRILEGMDRSGKRGARLSGGEPGLYWDHVLDLAATFAAAEPKAPLIIETSGAGLELSDVDALDAIEGVIVLAFGLKAGSSEGLARLTGMSAEDAEAAHTKQLENFAYAALECERLVAYGTLLDHFTTEEEYGGMQGALAKQGVTRKLALEVFKPFGGTNKYVPDGHGKE